VNLRVNPQFAFGVILVAGYQFHSGHLSEFGSKLPNSLERICGPAKAAPVDTPWMWTLAFGHHEDRTPTHGYEPTREAAMAAFAKSWRRES